MWANYRGGAGAPTGNSCVSKQQTSYSPLKMGVACQAGSEKIIVIRCIEDHWMDEDFVVFKVEYAAFNILSRQVVLDERGIKILHAWVLVQSSIL